ncbi:MAG TPA: malonic semialdehyde reductase [Ramlibacter sp.]|nr:malonic semialdehyde reductase [Ramlibacter sp.]
MSAVAEDIAAGPVLDRLFDEARSHSVFTARPIAPSLLREIYERMKWGATSMNCQPLRIQWMVSRAARERLAECVYEGNRAKVLGAPVCAVLGMDLDFVATLPKVFPHKADAVQYYAGKPAVVESTALRNSTLQGAYLMLTARLLGLDCGPMSGFHADKVDALCWRGTSIRTNFLCNLGYGEPSAVFPRSPRLSFEEVCDVL